MATLLGCMACAGESEETADSGDVTTLVGTGRAGHDGDGHSLDETSLHSPMEVVVAPDGRMFIIDWNNHAIRVAGVDGIVRTFAGTEPDEIFGDWPCQEVGNPTYCEIPIDQVAPTTAVQMNHPMDVVLLPDGSVAMAAWHNHKVERCTESGDVTILAGQMKPGGSGDGGPGLEALLNFPNSLVLDASDVLILADQRTNRLRRIELEGEHVITRIGGVIPEPGTPPLSDYSGDGGPVGEATFAFSPYDLAGGADNPPPGGGLALGDDGTLYVADTYNHCIRRVAPGSDGLLGVGDPAEEIVDVVAGTCGTAGLDGDGGAATSALFDRPHDVEFAPDGRLFIADTGNHVIRAVDLDTGVIERIAGTGESGFSGDLLPAPDAMLSSPYGIAFDLEGALLIVDTGNNRIRRILP